jgi:hypothetical protein
MYIPHIFCNISYRQNNCPTKIGTNNMLQHNKEAEELAATTSYDAYNMFMS